MKNILFISHSGRGGGAQSVLSFTINNTFKDEKKYKRFVVYPCFQGNEFVNSINKDAQLEVFCAFFRANSASLWKNILCNIINIPALFYFVVFCYTKRIDVIYANTSVNLFGAFLSKVTGKKMVWHIHEQSNKNVKIVPTLMIPIYRCLFMSKKTKIIFVSKHTCLSWEKLLNNQINNSTIVYSPVKKALKQPEYKIRNKSLVFGYLGAFVFEKNIFALLNAFKQVVLNYPDLSLELIFCGRGPLLNEMLQQSKSLRINEYITIVEFSSDVSAFFTKINVLVQPSFNESWGLVALEALSYGKAVLVTKESGLVEILNDYEDCIFIDPLDVKDIEKKMSFLIEDNNKLLNLATRGFDKYNKLNFNKEYDVTMTSLLKCSD